MTDARPDFELLTAWRGGDEQAGSALYERYASGVCRFFAGKLRSEDVADDLAQKTWLACVQGRDRIRVEASFRSYLFGTAHNLLREHLRRAPRNASAGSTSAAADLGPTASTILGGAQQERILLEALRGLPIDAQVLFQLRFWECLSVPEIAEIIGKPEGTVKTQLRRGCERLAQSMERIARANRGLDSTSTTTLDWAERLREWFRPSRAAEPQPPLPRERGG